MNSSRNYIKDTYPDILKDSFSDYGDGWIPHVNKITDTLVHRVNQYNTDNGTELKFHINQIKQKFGGLRYYISFYDTDGVDNDFITNSHKYVWDMEFVAGFICEQCGMYAEKRGGGWITTLCDGCYNERNDEDKDDEFDEDIIDGTIW